MESSHLSSALIPSPSTLAQDIWLLGMPAAQRQVLKDCLQTAGVVTRTLASALSLETVWVNGRSLLWWGVPDAQRDLAHTISILQKTTARCTFPIFQFQPGKAPRLHEFWGAVDDVVMGGMSASSLRQGADHAQFTGRVSTQNSGGFVSVRTRNFEPPYDLSAWQGLRLEIRGDGQRYKLILRDRATWDGAAYCGSFDTAKGEWQGIEVPFANLVATFRARTIPNASPLDSAQVCALQLMLSKFEYDGQLNSDFQPGSFSLEIRDISVYKPVKLPPLVVIAASETTAQEYDTLLSTSGLTAQVVLLKPEDTMDKAWTEALLSTIDSLNVPGVKTR